MLINSAVLSFLKALDVFFFRSLVRGIPLSTTWQQNTLFIFYSNRFNIWVLHAFTFFYSFISFPLSMLVRENSQKSTVKSVQPALLWVLIWKIKWAPVIWYEILGHPYIFNVWMPLTLTLIQTSILKRFKTEVPFSTSGMFPQSSSEFGAPLSSSAG